MKHLAHIAVIVALSVFAGPLFGQSAPAAAGDPDAMRKLAQALPKLDIVGIKLGMSPQEAMAAIKAANPTLKIDLINTRLQRPGVQQFDRVPHWIVAHPVASRADNSGEVIVVQFTTPPGHSVVARVRREVIFPPNEPVMAANLISALEKKYGESAPAQADRVWLFDSSSGRLIANPSPLIQRLCAVPDIVLDSYDPTRDSGTIDLDSTARLMGNTADSIPECTSVAFVHARALGATPPNTLLRSLTVTIESPGLIFASRKATHDWLQQQADAIMKRQKDDASKRTGPKL